jgi:hypothetical protein
MLITKADGTKESFKPAKLQGSLKRAGASSAEAARITDTIEKTLYDGIRTQVIYREAFELLRKSTEPTAAKYSLRRALFGLGPTGFPFEDFLTRLFEHEGYTTKTRSMIKGKCAIHEVDISAHKKDDSFVAEAKFHIRQGVKSDLQDAMYSYARYLDLQSHPSCAADKCGIKDLYLVTNTKFTSAAVTYAECVGLKLLSWNYPRHSSLQQRIENAGLYPITVLSKLSNAQKRSLLEQGTIICADLIQKPEILRSTGISEAKLQAVISEARQLCS